jgi:hypothetical protein
MAPLVVATSVPAGTSGEGGAGEGVEAAEFVLRRACAWWK